MQITLLSLGVGAVGVLLRRVGARQCAVYCGGTASAKTPWREGEEEELEASLAGEAIWDSRVR